MKFCIARDVCEEHIAIHFPASLRANLWFNGQKIADAQESQGRTVI